MKKPAEMNEFEIFREQVEKELEKLSREEVVRFAWRCAVKALPFLGAKGNFDFWKKEERQKHLQSIFYLSSPYIIALSGFICLILTTQIIYLSLAKTLF